VADGPEKAPYEATPIAAAGSLPKPVLPGTVVVRESVEELIDAIAADLFFQAKACVRTFGDFHIAVSGGTTPEPLYRRLMYDPNYRELPWKRTHLWIVDERRVPEDDERSNFRMVRETLVDQSDIPREQVHPIKALSPTADTDYEAELRETLGWREKGHDRLDYVLLGMGGDGHTASLFPHSPALNADGRLVLINSGPKVTPPDRVTMTFDLLNASRFVGVMVTGEKKKPMIARVGATRGAGREKNNPQDLPILGIRPLAGELRWYLDAAACP
jgi:6-phosphogluconolactonase